MTATSLHIKNGKRLLRIGIDIDGVINDLERFHIDYGSRYCYENNLAATPDPAAYKIRHMYHWEREESLKFSRTYFHHLFLTGQYLRPMAPWVIGTLSQRHEIYLLTARPISLIEELALPAGHTTAFITQQWLRQHHIPYNSLIFTPVDKREAIQKHAIDIIIEDNPEFLELVINQRSLTVFCYHADYNVHIRGENVIRVYSWHHILDQIRQLEKSH